MRKTWSFLILLCVILSTFLPTARGALRSVCMADDRESLSFSKTIRVPDDYETIQEAIDEADPGDTILVAPGVYYEHILVDRSVLLIGEDKDETIIDCNGTGTGVTICADNVLVTGFTIKNATSDFWAVDTLAFESAVKLLGRNCTVTGNAIISCDVGIWLEHCEANNISGNDIPSLPYDLLDEEPDIYPLLIGIMLNESICNTIYSNRIEGAIISMVISGHGNNISKNSVKQSFYGGLLIEGDDNVIDGNTISSFDFWVFGAIWIEEGSNNMITSNNIESSCGIGVWIGEDNVIEDNTIYPSYSLEYQEYWGFSGIDLWDCSSSVIRSNSITGPFEEASVFIAESNNTIVVENIIAENDLGYGITIDGARDTKVYHNDFINNAYQAQTLESYNNIWDDGYPSGGNFWSDHVGIDLFCGPYQNITGSDGIIDNPYIINKNNTDHYPLKKPFNSRIDLSIFSPDISFSDPNPNEGQTVTITAKIHNSGFENVENVTVQFFDGTKPIDEKEIPFIPQNSYRTASVEWTAEHEGYHLFKVVVDPYNETLEMDEDNNEATRSLLVGEIIHLGEIILTMNLSTNETNPRSKVAVWVKAVYNTTYGFGEPVVGADVTAIIVGQGNQWSKKYTSKTGEYRGTIKAPDTPGNYTIAITVTDYTFWSTKEMDLTVKPEPPPEGVEDLTLSSRDISFSPNDPIENDLITVIATIHNIGTDSAINILVTFYDDGVPIKNGTIDLIPGGESRTTPPIQWNATPCGLHEIKVVVDPYNTTGEPPDARYNNMASKNIFVYSPLPDLTLLDIQFSDNTPVVNQVVSVNATIQNHGGVDAYNILVAFYDNNNPIGDQIISQLLGKDGETEVSISYVFTTDGKHNINVTADPDNAIDEGVCGTAPNWLNKTIYVHLPSPDLTLSSSGITFSDPTPRDGDTIIINATIYNVGEKNAPNVTVKFCDRDQEIGNVTIPWIPAGSNETVSVTWNATPIGRHLIKVVIVPLQEEIDNHLENNNMATTYINVCLKEVADLCIHSEDIVFSNTNPDPGENVTIHATVHNIGEADAQPVTVIFYINDIRIGSPITISSISPGETENASTNWIAFPSGSHVVKVKVDTPNESNENNNEAISTRAIEVGTHDIAITNVTPSKTVVGQNYSLYINVTVTNKGTFTETSDVTAYYNSNVINSTTITLPSGGSTTLTIPWNTTGVAKGNYTITAHITPLPSETDTTDNTLTNGTVLVTIPGDVNGDRKVRVDDVLAIALAFGNNYGDPDWDQVKDCDVNCDLKIRVDDVLIAALNFGEGPW